MTIFKQVFDDIINKNADVTACFAFKLTKVDWYNTVHNISSLGAIRDILVHIRHLI